MWIHLWHIFNLHKIWEAKIMSVWKPKSPKTACTDGGHANHSATVQQQLLAAIFTDGKYDYFKWVQIRWAEDCARIINYRSTIM